MVRRFALVLVSLSLGAAAGVTGASAGAPVEPFALDGHAWDSLSGDARDAYLAGFVAGAAAHQATSGRAGITGARAAAIALRLRRAGSLDFPFGVNVYRSHLDDYYFYRNRRSEPILQVLVDMNAHSRGAR